MNQKAITIFLLKLRKVIAYKILPGIEETFGSGIKVGKSCFNAHQKKAGGEKFRYLV